MSASVSCRITHSEEDGCWYVEAPGFYDGILTDGTTLDHAKEMAGEAVCGLIETYLEYDMSFALPPENDGPDFYPIALDPGLALALWLRNERKSRNMTLFDVAEKMGVRYQVYQKLENPRTANPTLKTIPKIEQVFDRKLVTL